MGTAVLEPVISGPLERLGTAAVIVIAAYYLVKYFIAELAKKDTRNTEITDRFITAMTTQTGIVTKVIADNTTAMANNTSAMDDLKDAVRQLTTPNMTPRASDTLSGRRHQ